MKVRLLTTDDVPWAMERISAEGWAPSRPSFEAILAHDPEGCFVAEIDGVRGAMVTTTRYGATAWIGHLIVLPELRRRGLGTRLMRHALDHLHAGGIRTIRLEADPPGVSIYRRLGFVDEFESLRFRITDPQNPSSTADPISDLDPDLVAAFDAPLFGDDRSRFLRLLSERAAFAFMIRSYDETSGYVMALPTDSGVFIGPLVALTPRSAWDLLAASLASCESGTMTIGIPSPNLKAVGIVRDLGFEPRPPSIRMVLGGPVASGRRETIFAIANGATG